MSKNEPEFSLETPVDVSSTAYTNDVRKVTNRRISFGDIDALTELMPLQNDPSAATLSPTTPQKSLKVEVDSPYMALTPERVAALLANDRRAPPIDHKLHGSTKGCDFDLLPLFICGLLPLNLLANKLSTWNKGN